LHISNYNHFWWQPEAGSCAARGVRQWLKPVLHTLPALSIIYSTWDTHRHTVPSGPSTHPLFLDYTCNSC